ncbi:uncharacterized protein BDZ99DRAFT_527859 [Mytilinidion resinicola]|uniref:Uncharacterized protein n=1 Tax=Mytilinidion resinicola TaxID=574789 RepID=A0A6A6Y0W0_9PEZI|nr:uncharacterized protein BDZ99DRAFT_527859 [Mytilinidion resinicola]KAF2802198.1 hypothetical protein BDZ99DRAFT_527859 [Mytilinidion resinicola]
MIRLLSFYSPDERSPITITSFGTAAPPPCQRPPYPEASKSAFSGENPNVVVSTVAPPTLTNLPAELRQQILAGTIIIKISGPHKIFLTTPAASVCRLLHADLVEISRIWIPPSCTPTVIKNPTGMDGLAALTRFYKEHAKTTKREWAGLTSIRIHAFNTETTRLPPRPSYDKSVPNPLKPDGRPFNLQHAWREDWPREIRKLPASITHVVIDLNVPTAQLALLEACGPGDRRVPQGRKRPYTRFQREY